ncbi:MAG: hypothetical protein U9Q06_01415 [Nanoarchaeota archaeon]|nr:hypothetical protein [Nanoarchaeota archaeon]
MAKKSKGLLSKVISLVAWLTGVIVALAVGFALTGEVLTIPTIPGIITVVAGWIVIVATILGVILALIDSLK